ncbi:MAG: ABC transporter substrate-binding protein [Ruminococcaceae bacterium]|nr:ABC transporter substrate-binding protein [Oscillospiraceae bacterium]
MKKVLSVALILVMCLGGCKRTAGPLEETPRLTGDFTLAMHMPESLDPLRATQKSGVLVFDLVYDSLVYVDREMRPVPYLAESCTVSEDGMTISFTLHNGILWHDGAAFTATDVEHTVGRIRALGADSIYYDRLRYIDAVRVQDMLHFDITLTEPHITVLNLLDFPIVPSHRSDLDTTMVGTGQYRLDTYTPQKSMTLKKNENWTLSEPPAMETVHVKMLERSADVANMVKIGEVTAVATSMESVGGLGIGDNMEITHYPTLEYVFLGFNLATTCLSPYRVRYAVSGAIDRAKIIEDVFLGYGNAATVPVPPTSYMYVGTETDKTARDTAGALALLYEEGYNLVDGAMQKEQEDGDIQTLSLSLLVNEENERRKKLADIIRENLAEIGITVLVEAVPFATYTARLADGDFDMYIGGCTFSADLSYDFLLGEAPVAKNGYTSPEMELALDTLDPQRTDDTIRAAYGRFQEVFLRDMPLTGICFLDGALVHTSALKGLDNLAASKLYRNIGKWYLQ